MKIYRIALRNIMRNKRRSLLSGLAIMIAAAAIVFLFGFISGMIDSMKDNLWTYATGAVRIRNADYVRYERLNPLHLAIPDYQALVRKIQDDPEGVGVSPRITFPGRIITVDEGGSRQVSILGWGIDFETEKFYQDYEKTLYEGRLPRPGEREAIVGRDRAEELGLTIGDKFTVLAQTASRGSNAMTFSIVGLISYPLSGMNKTTVQIPLNTAQRFLHLPNQVQEILVKVDRSTGDFEAVAERLKALLSSSVPLSIQDYTEGSGIAGMLEVNQRMFMIIAIIFFFLAATVIVNTTIMVIFERMREIGTLGAIGMTKRQLVRLFFLEAFFISVISGFIGVVIGSAITGYFGVVGFNTIKDAFQYLDSVGISSDIYPVLSIRSTVIVLVFSILTTTVAVWFPSRRAAKITPVEALRHV